MFDTDEILFDETPSSLICETMLPDDMTENGETAFGRRKELPAHITNNLTVVSTYYIYTGTPPHGYGTQAPKVAETVERAYSFNKKPRNKTVKIGPYEVERMHWEREDGKFPTDEVHGNFVASEELEMIKKFLKTHHRTVDELADKTINKLMHGNSDVLTRGRQTYCPFTDQSVTAATAYKRFHDFFTDNLGPIGPSCLEWTQSIFKIMEMEKVKYLTVERKIVKKRIFDKKQQQHVWIEKEVAKQTHAYRKSVQETRDLVMDLLRRFASYIKHKERGKMDRRAIASAGMGLRVFFHAIEEFHLALAKHMEGSTISIGGEEKKAKIAANLATDQLEEGRSTVSCQGTEDASKWNECLAPSAFAIMHTYFFDDGLRQMLNLPRPNENGKLLSKIMCAGNFIMSVKQVQLGQGVQVHNGSQYSRIKWIPEHKKHMNVKTREWFEKVESKITPNGRFLNASPGMLMGMLNAGSTTLGLLAVNHRMDPKRMRVLPLDQVMILCQCT